MICLCSSSESKALLLNNFGIVFIQKSTQYDEDQITSTIAKDFVYTTSKGKLEPVIKEFGLGIYLESGLWKGKAGGCMVEGFCKKYIKSIDGYESRAMGLQAEVLLPWIKVL